jgi:hypothetical protein
MGTREMGVRRNNFLSHAEDSGLFRLARTSQISVLLGGMCLLTTCQVDEVCDCLDADPQRLDICISISGIHAYPVAP